MGHKLNCDVLLDWFLDSHYWPAVNHAISCPTCYHLVFPPPLEGVLPMRVVRGLCTQHGGVELVGPPEVLPLHLGVNADLEKWISSLRSQLLWSEAPSHLCSLLHVGGPFSVSPYCNRTRVPCQDTGGILFGPPSNQNCELNILFYFIKCSATGILLENRKYTNRRYGGRALSLPFLQFWCPLFFWVALGREVA